MTSSFVPHALQWAAAQLQGGIQQVQTVESSEANQVFRLQTSAGSYILKLGAGLMPEHQRLLWLEGRLPAPHCRGFLPGSDRDALLVTAIEGKDLACLCSEWPAHMVVEKLAEALRQLHAAPLANWPFARQGDTLVHGDACLPNFMFHNGALSGYIDVGGLAAGHLEQDLAAAVWSLQYNMGPGHGKAFLSAYGSDCTSDAEVERLRLLYEEDW